MVGLRRRHLVAALNPASQVFTIEATATLNPTNHANKKLLLGGDGSTAQTYTLPNATGTGNRYEFEVSVTNTGTYVIQAGTAADEMNGMVVSSDGTGDTSLQAFDALAGGDMDTFTLGNVTRGELGSWVTMTDIATNLWMVHGLMVCSDATPVTPFTSAV